MNRDNKNNNGQSNKYQMLDGKIIDASSNKELIEKMRADSLNPGTNLRDYMLNVSESSYHYNGSNINIDTYDNFINDLIKHGFIKVVSMDN